MPFEAVLVGHSCSEIWRCAGGLFYVADCLPGMTPAEHGREHFPFSSRWSRHAIKIPATSPQPYSDPSHRRCCGRASGRGSPRQVSMAEHQRSGHRIELYRDRGCARRRRQRRTSENLLMMRRKGGLHEQLSRLGIWWTAHCYRASALGDVHERQVLVRLLCHRSSARHSMGQIHT
jgi:hypothetical protein